MANFNISSLFGNSNSGFFGSVNFSEFASIRNGSYAKLTKAYYGGQKNPVSAKADKTDKTDKNNKTDKTTTKKETVDKSGLTKMQTEAKELKDAAKAFEKDDLWKQKNGSYDMDKISSAVKNFVSEYNNVVDQSAKVSSKDVTMQTGFMTSMSKTMSKSLEKVGITVGDDGKLSVNEETFKKADEKDVKALFSGKYSYASQIADKATAISSAVNRNSGLYSSTGSWSSTLSEMFDQWS